MYDVYEYQCLTFIINLVKLLQICGSYYNNNHSHYNGKAAWTREIHQSAAHRRSRVRKSAKKQKQKNKRTTVLAACRMSQKNFEHSSVEKKKKTAISKKHNSVVETGHIASTADRTIARLDHPKSVDVIYEMDAMSAEHSMQEVIVKEEPVEIIEISDNEQSVQPKAEQKTNPMQRAANLNKIKVEIKQEFNSKTVPNTRNQKAVNTYSYKCATTPSQLKAIAKSFKQQIEHLKLQLRNALEFHNPSNQTLIIGKVFKHNKKSIEAYAFEFIRSELIGWIGKYQYQHMATPIFHSIANNHTHVTVICENTYAYECLETCIHDVSQMPQTCQLHVERLPPTIQLIYLYDAVYGGLTRDPLVLLKQIKLHHDELESERWIIVSHELCNVKFETYYMLLIDEPSALALTYHYKNNLFICMQNVVFRRRGCI